MKIKTREALRSIKKETNDYNLQNNRNPVQLQMGVGMSIYNPETDKEYMDVFLRADSAMYEDKKKKKNAGRS